MIILFILCYDYLSHNHNRFSSNAQSRLCTKQNSGIRNIGRIIVPPIDGAVQVPHRLHPAVRMWSLNFTHRDGETDPTIRNQVTKETASYVLERAQNQRHTSASLRFVSGCCQIRLMMMMMVMIVMMMTRMMIHKNHKR